ncbi:MAG: OsmC family protein [Deltaproteobacteria bacterium]|nr:OsmC family protein [Deltaproteobacteria bacterium]
MSEQTALDTKQNLVVNGVNVTQLVDTVGLIKENSDIAGFKFRASNKWINGGHNRSEINEYYGALQENSREEAFVMDNDEPPVLLGEDKGANPVEYVLHALAGCMTTTMVYKAALLGIKLDEVESELEGDLDVRGLLEISDDVRNGYQNIRVNFKVKADGAAPETLKQLEKLCMGSPVFDIVTNSVPVTITVNEK